MNSPLAIVVAICFLCVLYTGLGFFFYTPEEGFGWFLQFVTGTLIVLILFVAYVLQDAKKKMPDDQAKEDFPSS